MKQIIFFGLTFLSIQVFAQDKYNFTSFNKLTEVEGTEYVIARIENYAKTEGLKNRYLLFINSTTGTTTQVDFPNEGYLDKIE